MRAQGRADGTDQQQHEQGVGVVEPEHQHRHRGQGHARRPRPGRRPRSPSYDGPTRCSRPTVATPSAPGAPGCSSSESPKRRTESAIGQSESGRLVDGDRARGVAGAEEERLPRLRAGLHGRGVEGVRPAARAEAPEVEQPGGASSSPSSAGRAQAGSSTGPRHGRVTVSGTGLERRVRSAWRPGLPRGRGVTGRSDRAAEVGMRRICRESGLTVPMWSICGESASGGVTGPHRGSVTVKVVSPGSGRHRGRARRGPARSRAPGTGRARHPRARTGA